MNSSHFVYAIHGGELTKIGVSQKPHTRLEFMQINCPVPLTLLGVVAYENVEIALLAERKFHETFAKWHSYGEWFAVPILDLKNAMPLEQLNTPSPRFEGSSSAKTLNSWRQRMGYTIMQAAKELGIHRNNMTAYCAERRKIPDKVLQKCFDLEIAKT